MPLKQFSKILIFKNTPETKAAFGVNGDMDEWDGQNFTASPDKQFNGTYPTENLSNFTSSFFANNLLHAIGTEEPIGAGTTGLSGWNLDPVSSGKAYIIDGFIKAFDIDEYTGAVAIFADLDGIDTPAVGDEYVVANENKVYTRLAADPTAAPALLERWDGGVDIPFTFAYPSGGLDIDDILFYGDDPNNLRVAGKITEVYEEGDAEFTAGKRFKLSKENTPVDSNYQDIYYYRNSWNGKSIPVDITEGFYVLIAVENSNNQRIIYPFLNSKSSAAANSSTQIVEPKTGELAYTDLIRVKRISEKYRFDQDRVSNDPENQEIIPCKINRSNSLKTIKVLDNTGDAQLFEPGLFPTTNDFPYWVAYFINPYGETSNSLLKSSVYAIEINELLPYYTIPSTAKNTTTYNNFLNRFV